MVDPARTTLGLDRHPPHDYGARRSQRWRRPWSPRVARTVTVLGAVLVGFVAASGVGAGRDVAAEQDARKDELIALIGARSDRVDALDAQVAQLHDRLDEAAAAEADPALTAATYDLEVATGFVALQGPGVALTLAEDPTRCSERPVDCALRDSDVRAAVNILFGAGAEAVAVNGERVMASTAIRSAGRSIVVNRQVLSPPVEVVAIGGADRLARDVAASPFAADFDAWQRRYGLTLELAEADALTVPAYRRSGRAEQGRAGRHRQRTGAARTEVGA